MHHLRFAPFETLAHQLLPFLAASTDGSHDISHLQRVWHNAFAIQRVEGGDAECLAASVLLHDCVAVEKSSPLRDQASRLAAERASDILSGLGWPAAKVALVCEAIHTHSFSAGLQPTSLEGQILQDADRLDAIGAIGIARCFYTAGRMGSSLYEASDPLAIQRAADDRAYALDHFPKKLFLLGEGFHTREGSQLAAKRMAMLKDFYTAMVEEVGNPLG
jgi:uncharacterized protein